MSPGWVDEPGLRLLEQRCEDLQADAEAAFSQVMRRLGYLNENGESSC